MCTNQAISIHALLAESDGYSQILSLSPQYFNPRSPCGERLSPVTSRGGHMIFQSTLSLRRATAPGNRKPCAMVDFNPRSPCGERRRQRRTIQCRFRISIHALLAESDFLYYQDKFERSRFQSTLSLRRATCAWLPLLGRRDISIHALLAESDRDAGIGELDLIISIHALLAESDGEGGCVMRTINVFQSTLSLRRATPLLPVVTTVFAYFNPRSPCGERPVFPIAPLTTANYFNPRSPCGERPLSRSIWALQV